MLYGASAAYHTFYVSEKFHRALRKLNHSMIYFLIAGSYTPFSLVTLNGAVGWTLLTIIWMLTRRNGSRFIFVGIRIALPISNG